MRVGGKGAATGKPGATRRVVTPQVRAQRARVGANPVARPPAHATTRVAAIDIGSNSLRQIVADVSPSGEIRVVDEMKAQPRLGEGVAASGMLGTRSMERAAEALARMATLARQLGAGRIEVVATSAVRDASNGQVFLDMVRAETGLSPRVLDGEQEARLSFRSALAHFDLGEGRAAVADIGGGSLELVLSADGLVDRLVSLPFGAIRLTEQFLEGGGSRRKAMKRLRRTVRDTLRDQLPAREWRGAQLIGSGGTFTNLAGMVLARAGMPAARGVHATRVSRADVEHLLDALEDMPIEERRAVAGLNPARADIIVAGLAVVAEVMARLEAHELSVSSYGIREGLLLETARVTPVVAIPGEARQRSVRQLAERCRFEERHAVHVQRLALQLFDALGTRLGLTAEDRRTLADAALLHDVGYHISYDKHHKHSYYLVLNAELLGMAPAEQVAVANVARYHRGAEPRRAHRNFGSLDRALRRRVRRLAALLRTADGFDRGHVGAVASLRVRWLGHSLRLYAEAASPEHSLRLELWGASRKAGLLAALAGVPVEIVAPGGEVAARVEPKRR